MLSTIWFSEEWAEGLLIAAAAVFAAVAALELLRSGSARDVIPALAPLGLCFLALALLAF